MTALFTDAEFERVLTKYHGPRLWRRSCTDCHRPLMTRGTAYYCPACQHKHSTFLGAESHA